MTTKQPPPIPPKPPGLSKFQSTAHTVRVLLEMWERVNRPDASLGVARMAEEPTSPTEKPQIPLEKPISLEDLELALQEASRSRRASRSVSRGKSPKPWEPGWTPSMESLQEPIISATSPSVVAPIIAPEATEPIETIPMVGLGMDIPLKPSPDTIPTISLSTPDKSPLSQEILSRPDDDDPYNVPMSDELRQDLEREPNTLVEAKQLTFGRMSVKRGRGSSSLAFGGTEQGLPVKPASEVVISTDTMDWTDPNSIVLSMMHLTSVPMEKLGPTIHTLVLSYNNLESFSADVVRALPKLECLDLTGNQISSLPWRDIGEVWGQAMGKFGGVVKDRWSVYSSNSSMQPTLELDGSYKGLRELWLGRNKLSSVGTEVGWLVGLEVIDLGWNQITSLPPQIFEHTILLSHVSLSHNPLTNLPSSLGLRQSSLRTLLLDDLSLEPGIEEVVKPYMSAVKRCMELERSPSPDVRGTLTKRSTLAREVDRQTNNKASWNIGNQIASRDHTMVRNRRGDPRATLRGPSPEAPRMSQELLDLLRRRHRLMRRLLLHLRDIHDLDPWINYIVAEENRIQTEEMLHQALNLTHSRRPSEAPYTPKTEKALRKKDKPPEIRLRILQEILATEKTYVRELQTLQDLYATPSEGRLVPSSMESTLSPNMVMERVLTPEEHKIVFQNLGMILKLHRDYLLPALEEAIGDGLGLVDDETLKGRVGRCFVRYAPFFKLYSTYYNGFDQALDFLDELDGEKGKSPVVVKQITRGKWKALVEQARRDRRHTQLNVQAYLLLPVQRLPRYRMLLESLWEVTNLNHPDEGELTQAVEDVAARVRECNDQKKEWEGMQTVVNGILKQIKRRDDDVWADIDWGRLSLPQQYQIQEQLATRVKLQQQQMTDYKKDDGFKPILPSTIIPPRSTSRNVRKSMSSEDGWVHVESPDPTKGSNSPVPSLQSRPESRSESRLSTGDVLSWSQAATLSTGSELLKIMTSRRRLLKSSPWRVILACFRDSVPDLEIAQFLQLPLANVPLTQQSAFVKPDPRYPTMVTQMGEVGGVIKAAVPNLPVVMEQKKVDPSTGLVQTNSSVMNIVGRDDELILFGDVLLWCRILPIASNPVTPTIPARSPSPSRASPAPPQQEHRYELIKAMDLDCAGNQDRKVARLVDVADLPCAVPGYTTLAAQEEQAMLAGETLQESRFLRISDPVGDVVVYCAVPNPNQQQALNPLGLGSISGGSHERVSDTFMGGLGEREAEEWVDLINNGSGFE